MDEKVLREAFNVWYTKSVGECFQSVLMKEKFFECWKEGWSQGENYILDQEQRLYEQVYSNKAIEKWVKSYKISKPGRGYWQKLRGRLTVGQHSLKVPD